MKILLHLVTALVLSLGIQLTVSNGMHYTKAQLTGVGSDILTHPAASPLLKEVFPTHSFVPLYEQATAADQMVVGILLILLGFFMHALLVSHGERNVRITAVPRQEKPRTRTFFWIEMRV
jgi:hypothetical protein